MMQEIEISKICLQQWPSCDLDFGGGRSESSVSLLLA